MARLAKFVAGLIEGYVLDTYVKNKYTVPSGEMSKHFIIIDRIRNFMDHIRWLLVSHCEKPPHSIRLWLLHCSTNVTAMAQFNRLRNLSLTLNVTYIFY